MSDDRLPEAKPGCPFCPDNGMVQTLAESSFGYATWAVNPPIPGCILLIPRHHITNYLLLPTTWHAEEVVLLRQLVRSDIIMDLTMFTPSWNLSRETGQRLPHLHQWWIPRAMEHPESAAFGLGTASLIAFARSQSRS